MQHYSDPMKIYLTTYAKSGRSGTVPVWFMMWDGEIYFCTHGKSLKARRIANNPRVRVAVGRADAPSFEGSASAVDDPAFRKKLIETYRRKYRIMWLLLGRRIRRDLKSGTEAIYRIIPQKGPQEGP